MQLTKEKIVNASNRFKTTKMKGILTKAEQEEKLSKSHTVMTISSSEDNVFFFVDDYCFGLCVLPSHYVSSSAQIPMDVVPREGLESGVISTIDDYIRVFERDSRLIESVDELIEVINA